MDSPVFTEQAPEHPGHTELRKQQARRRQLLVTSAVLWLAVWLAGSILLAAMPRPRLLALGQVGPELQRNPVAEFDCGLGVGLLDCDDEPGMELQCFIASPPSHGLIRDDDNQLFGNFEAYPGHGYAGFSMDGCMKLWDPQGSLIWQAWLDEDFPGEFNGMTAQLRRGQDDRLYLFNSGRCFLYGGGGKALDSLELGTEVDLAGEVLICPDGRILYTARDGRIWVATPPAGDGLDWTAQELDLQLPQGSPAFMTEGISNGRPVQIICGFSSRGMECHWSDGGQWLALELPVGNVLRQHLVWQDGNLIAISDFQSRNRFYFDEQGLSLRRELRQLPRPLGQFDMEAAADGRLFIHAARFDDGLLFGMLQELAKRWPALNRLARMPGGGLVVHDPERGINWRFRLPRALRALSLPDANGNMLLLEQGDSQSRVLAMRLSWPAGDS